MSRIVLLEDKFAVLLLTNHTQAQAHELYDQLNAQQPGYNWLVVTLADEATVSDMRGRPDLTAKAQELWDALREEGTL